MTASSESAPAAGAQGVNIRLVAAGNSDQPVFANLTSTHAGTGVAFVDFGFLDPNALGEISRLARSGTKVPEQLNGRLAVRVALGLDTLAQLHQQIGQVLQALRGAR
jgi:hypothetical protein